MLITDITKKFQVKCSPSRVVVGINLLSVYFLSSPVKAVNEILNSFNISNLIEITEK